MTPGEAIDIFLKDLPELREDLVKLLSEIKAHSKPELKFYSTKEASEIIGVSTRTLHRIRESNSIGYSQYQNKIWFSRKDIEDFMDENHIKSNK